MVNIHSDTDNVVIICYPAYAGGKFLINSLSLSNNAIMQHEIITEMQLNNLEVYDLKVNYLIQNVNNTSKWNDINLNAHRIFGVNEDEYINPSFSKLLEKVTSSPYKFFYEVHDPENLHNILNYWNNAKVIVFVESQQFIYMRANVTRRIEDYWDTIKQSNWPNVPPKTLEEYYNLDQNIINELEQINHKTEKIYPNKIRRLLNNHDEFGDQYKKYISSNDVYYWNNNWYFSKEQTIQHIKEIYEWLDMTIVDIGDIMRYYDAWNVKKDMLGDV